MDQGIVLSSALIQLIEQVSDADSHQSAVHSLLKSLLSVFQMDQASLFAKENGQFRCLYALDNTGKILPIDVDTGAGHATGVFSSSTHLEKALLVMEPIYLDLNKHDELTPMSIKSALLRQIVCLPLARTPGTAIFLGSRSLAQRKYSDAEMGQFKIAARAAWLAIRQFKTQESLQAVRNELKTLKDTRKSLLYSGEMFGAVIAEVERIAPFNVSILLTGESGVGKEEIARHIHAHSGRSGNFVAVNCANLSESLLESELFGYRKGAFTGATSNKDGLFKIADGGTLFLDELAELPFNLQAKLLRALQEKQIRPIGSTDDITVDVRIIAATHQDLETRIARSEFRSDLFYRVNEFAVRIPALRERPEDIEVLAEHFMNHASLEMNLPRRRLDPAALELLRAHPWTGNVRELKSLCRTTVILARDTVVMPADLRLQRQQTATVKPASETLAKFAPPAPAATSTQTRPPAPPTELPPAITGSLRDLSREYERQLIRRMLESGLSQSEIASNLDISVRTLQRILADNDSALASETAPN